MRILITTDTLGGVWNYSINLASGLLRAGCSVCLVSFGREPNPDQEGFVEEARDNFTSWFVFISMPYPLEWMPGETLIAESTLALGKLIQSYQPDLLHFNQYCYGSIKCNIPKLVVAHSDVISWWYECRGVQPPADEWHALYHSVVSDGLASADRVIAPSNWQMRQLEKHYGYRAGSGIVIYNGTNEGQHSGERHLQAVTAGRMWDIAKNLEILELARLHMTVYVAGATKLDDQGTKLGDISGSVQQLGQLGHSELQTLFAESAIYIAPSLYEPFGLAPLEAARQKCALVLSDIPTFRELWQEDALYFSPRHPAELERAVYQLTIDPSLLNTMASRAQRRALDLYSMDACVANYLSLYEDMLGVGAKNAA